jgi:hypothetical protein
MRRVFIDNGELGWGLTYYGGLAGEPLPTVEDFQRDLELLKKDIEKLSPLK